MSIIEWLLLFELIASIGLIVWVLMRAVKKSKKSPAARALEEHLLELEKEKTHTTAPAEVKAQK